MTNETKDTARDSKGQGWTKGPWLALNMTTDGGRQMTPEEIGEYVANSVRIGVLDMFLFVSAKHDDGSAADVCLVGNGTKGPYNANLIAAAPDMAGAMQEFIDRCDRGEVRSKRTYSKFKNILAKARGNAG